MATTAVSIKVDYWCTRRDGQDTSYLKWQSGVCVCEIVCVLCLGGVSDASTLFWHLFCKHKDVISWLKMTPEGGVFQRVYKLVRSFIILCSSHLHNIYMLVLNFSLFNCAHTNVTYCRVPSSCAPVAAKLTIKWGEIKVYCSVMQSVLRVERWAGCPLRWADSQMI